MPQESFDEFMDGKPHEFTLFTTMVKRHLVIANIDNAAVENRPASQITRKIGQNTVAVILY